MLYCPSEAAQTQLGQYQQGRKAFSLLARARLLGCLLAVALWGPTLHAAVFTDLQANQLADMIVAASWGQTAMEYAAQDSRADDESSTPQEDKAGQDQAGQDQAGQDQAGAAQPQAPSTQDDPYADGAFSDEAYADDPYADASVDAPLPTSAGPNDPFEPFNRGVFAFNQFLDHWLLRPVAKGYVAITPEPMRLGINNFFNNLFAPTTVVNDLLQGRPHQAMRDTGRFFINLIVGFGGLFDPASAMGLPAHDEDFGQTLGVWGADAGPYLMLPLLGPTSFRDGLGRIADYPSSVYPYMDDNDTRLVLGVLGAVNSRANLLRLDRLLEQSFDPYAFMRGAYLSTREAAIEK